MTTHFGKWNRSLIILSNEIISIKDPTLFPQGSLYLVDHQWQYFNQRSYSLSTRKSVLSWPPMTILQSKLLLSFHKYICTEYHQWQYLNQNYYSLSTSASILIITNDNTSIKAPTLSTQGNQYWLFPMTILQSKHLQEISTNSYSWKMHQSL